MEEGPLVHEPVLRMVVAQIQPSDVKSGLSCSETAAGVWMAWAVVCYLLACLVRAEAANAEDEMSVEELGWPGGLASSSGGQKEVGCVSELQHLAPTPRTAFPSQGCIQLTIISLGWGCFLTV